MLYIRQPYTPSFFTGRSAVAGKRSSVRVGGDSPTWSYTDRNDKVWTFEDRADAVPAGQRFVASTDQYPESTYKFYEATNDELIATVENLAKSQSDEYAVEHSPDAPELDEWSRSGDPDSGSTVSEDFLIAEDAVKKPSGAVSNTGVALTKSIQTMLMSLGYDLGAKYGADGKIGPYTRGAIVKFKKDHSIAPANATITADFRKALSAASTAKKTGAPGGAASASGSGGLIIAVIAALAVGIYFLVKKMV